MSQIPLAKTTSANGEISCSVEETNRIRISLGLKPLRTEKKDEPQIQKPPTEPKPSQTSVRERIENARHARLRRSRSVASRSIAEQSLFEEDDRDDDRDRDLHAWVERSRQAERSAEKSSSDRPASVPAVLTENAKGLNGAAAIPGVDETVSLTVGESKTLTLRDVALDEGDQDDLLEDHIDTRATQKKMDINGMLYDGTDRAEFQRNDGGDGVDSAAEPNVYSAARTERVIESDYKPEKTKVFSKKRLRRDGKKRRRTRKKGDELPLSTGHVLALRKAADANIGEDSDEEDSHYRALANARKATDRKRSGDASEAVLDAVEEAALELDNDESMQGNERKIVVDDMNMFLGRVGGVSAEDGTDTSPEETTFVNKSDGQRPDHNDMEVVLEGLKKIESDIPPPPPAEEPPIAKQATPAESQDPSETNGMTGIAATLNRLRTMGELNQRAPQRGRAKDKQYDDDEDSDSGDGKPRVMLSYTDEHGNQLTPKEAYRLMSHKFHGSKPGQNKREKQIRRMLEERRMRNIQAMHSNDTPLASTAALRAETRKLASAHVVLSGSKAMNAIDADQRDGKNAKGKSRSKRSRDKKEEGLPADSQPQEKVAFTIGGGIGRSSKRRRR